MADMARFRTLGIVLLLAAGATGPPAGAGEPCLLRGRVVDRFGRPASGADVHLAIAFSEFLPDGRPAYRNCLARSTRSGPDGTFLFPVPSPGHFDELRTPDWHVVRAESPEGVTTLRSVFFRWRETGIDAGDLVLLPAVPLSVAVEDPAGSPVPGATVRFEVDPGPLNASGTSDAAGAVAAPRIPAEGTAEVRIRVDHPQWCSEEVVVGAAEAGRGEPIRVRLTPGRTVRVRAVGPDGRPRVGMRVVATRRGPEGIRWWGPVRGESDRHGFFEVRGVPPEGALLGFGWEERGPFAWVDLPGGPGGTALDLGEVVLDYPGDGILTVRFVLPEGVVPTGAHAHACRPGLPDPRLGWVDWEDFHSLGIPVFGPLVAGEWEVHAGVDLDDGTELGAVVPGVRPEDEVVRVVLALEGTLSLVFRDPDRPGEELYVLDPEVSVDGGPFEPFRGSRRALRIRPEPGLRSFTVRATGYLPAEIPAVPVDPGSAPSVEVPLRSSASVRPSR